MQGTEDEQYPLSFHQPLPRVSIQESKTIAEVAASLKELQIEPTSATADTKANQLTKSEDK